MKSTQRSLGLLAASILAACSSQTTVIEGSDTSVFSPSVRLAVPLANEGMALELDVAHGEGDFDQRLGAGESVRLEDVTFSGPGTVRLEADLTRVYGGARFTHMEENGLGFSVHGGLSLSLLDATAQMGGVKDSTDVDSLGLALGIEPFLQLNDTWRLYGQVLFLPGIAGDYEEVELTEIDLGIAMRAFEHVELVLGWRRFEYEAEATGGVDSDLDIVLSGPHVSLRLLP